MSALTKQQEAIHDLKGVLTTLKSIQEEWLSKHPDDARFLSAYEICTDRFGEIIKVLELEITDTK